jgi:hypothetical protein
MGRNPIMKITAKSGAAMAAAAATLVLAGAASAPAFAAEMAKGHCVGANACKGKSACKTATSECGGKNSCKGTGYIESTKDECEAMMKDNPKVMYEEPKKS